jgi:hypothetical protein
MAVVVNNWSTPTLVINNQVVFIVPGSLEFTEGLGEQNVRTQSGGGGTVQLVYSDNAETKIADVKFKIFSTPPNINLARSWKINGSNNVISATHPSEDITRTFPSASLVNQYTIQASPEGVLELEFKTAQAV